jgi:hypothetical protein
MTRQLLLSGLLVIGTFTGMPQNTTFALWSTSTASTANQFSAGALHIAGGLATGTTLSMDHLIAGDNFDAQLDVDNSGSLTLRYALTTSADDASGLASALQATIRLKTANPCSMRDGTVLYTGALGSTSVGDPAHGLQPGDRALLAGGSEALCFTILLPDAVDSTLQATSAAATFQLTAEQQ